MSAIESVLSFFGFIPEVIIFIMCISYMTKSKSADSRLLFAGSFAVVLAQVFFASIPFVTRFTDWATNDLMGLIRVGRAVSILGSTLFCVGFVGLINKVRALSTAKSSS